MRRGLELPEEWRSHSALGEWLAATIDDSPTNGTASNGEHPLIELQQAERDRRAAEAQLSAGRNAARHAFVTAAAKALEQLEETTDAYVQLWQGLAQLGISQISALGEVLHAEELDPERHEIVGEARADSYVVRSAGIVVGDDVVQRAQVEAHR